MIKQLLLLTRQIGQNFDFENKRDTREDQRQNQNIGKTNS